MSIPSDSSRNICCPAQCYGTRMVLIPSVRRQNTLYPVTCPQPGLNFPYRIIRYSTPYQQIMSAYGIASNLHGNENNTNVNSTKKSLPTDDSKSDEPKSSEGTRNEDPVDLSSTNLTTFSSSSLRDNESNREAQKSPSTLVLKSPKKEPVTPPSSQPEPEVEHEQETQQEREHEQELEIEQQSESESYRLHHKRQPNFFNEDGLLRERSLEGWVGHVKPVPGIPRQAGSKREEVLKAARSLFSKRTRTLYHWLYPSTSKNKLKATVAAAWDTLSNAEKEFYISQVLGRFGVPAGSLMVNPQLGGFKGLSSSSGHSGGAPSAGTSGAFIDEAGRAVTNLLLSEEDVGWSSYPHAQNQEVPPSRKRRRQPRNAHGEGNSSRQHQEEEETRILKQIREESLEDDFADDPELSKEFEQFRWALHVSNSQEK